MALVLNGVNGTPCEMVLNGIQSLENTPAP